MRPKLDWMTEEDVDLWNGLYDIAEQPNQVDRFAESHENDRQSQPQTFAVYTVTPETFKIDFYFVEGDLHGGEERTVKLYNSDGIAKQ